MADSSTSRLADEATAPPGSSEPVHGALPDTTKEQEDTKGESAAASSEPMREELVQSAVSFLKHPKVVASSHVQRRSFLENKGLTVDEIEEAFRRLLSPPSNSTTSNTCKSQGVSDQSCGGTQQEAKINTECADGSGTSDPETVTPVVPRHPKSYMEIMEMIQRGERPDDIQDINDEPPNPDQPISEPRMAPKPKPWEIQGQESSGLDLKAHPSDSGESRSGVEIVSTSQATGSNNSSDHGDLLLTAERAMGSEAPPDEDTASSEQ